MTSGNGVEVIQSTLTLAICRVTMVEVGAINGNNLLGADESPENSHRGLKIKNSKIRKRHLLNIFLLALSMLHSGAIDRFLNLPPWWS